MKSELESAIKYASGKLKEISALCVLGAEESDALLPADCYRRWANLAQLHGTLERTAPLLETRLRAWEVVKGLVDEGRIKKERERLIAAPADQPAQEFSHDGVEMSFPAARHLALTAYLTTTWSIYDRLTNVCGRIAGTDGLGQNPKQNPKLCEDLLYDKQKLGFSIGHHLRATYAWPIRISYGIRNWLVHEGYQNGSIPFFEGNNIHDGLTLHEDAVKYLAEMSDFRDDGSGSPASCRLKESRNPWGSAKKKDLLVILPVYHAEIDDFFRAFLIWVVESFANQVLHFSSCDGEVLQARAAAPPPAPLLPLEALVEPRGAGDEVAGEGGGEAAVGLDRQAVDADGAAGAGVAE